MRKVKNIEKGRSVARIRRKTSISKRDSTSPVLFHIHDPQS
jgi:hypothetical protein